MTNRPYNRTLARLRPLTVQLLVALLVWLARPRPGEVALGSLVVATGEGLRVWAAGHLTKTRRLVTSGPYSYTRNPLYLGRLLIFTGLCIMCRLPHGAHWLVLLTGHAVFFAYYLPRKERVEPARLLGFHGAAYERYRRAVPALVPALSAYSAADGARWSAQRMFENREHWMIAGLAAAIAVLLMR